MGLRSRSKPSADTDNASVISTNASQVSHPSVRVTAQQAQPETDAMALAAKKKAEAEAGASKRRKRTFSTFAGIFGFSLIIYFGHWMASVYVVACQYLIFSELNVIMNKVREARQDATARLLPWYNFWVALYYLYGNTFVSRFPADFANESSPLHWLATHHNFVCFTLYLAGFVFFVLNLQKGHYRNQFGQLAWTYGVILVCIVQSNFLVANTLDGLIWFFFPALLIIVNDTQAYVFGRLFGRTSLIKLSPNKTWEGFIGATIMTFLFAFFASGYLLRFTFLLCPKQSLTWGFEACTLAPVFVPQDMAVPALFHPLATMLGNTSGVVSVAPFQLHALSLALFASMVAPFGGFFASGFKRAFNIDDFGDSIPGHGGMTDRMDCQIVMGAFVYVYLHSFVTLDDPVTKVLTLLASMDSSQQAKVLEELTKMVAGNAA